MTHQEIKDLFQSSGVQVEVSENSKGQVEVSLSEPSVGLNSNNVNLINTAVKTFKSPLFKTDCNSFIIR